VDDLAADKEVVEVVQREIALLRHRPAPPPG
jgi:hypothetical protein